MSNKIIRYLYYALFFFTPLVMSSRTSEIFEFNKMMLIYFITVFITATWLVQIVKTKIKLYRHPMIAVMLLFLASQFLSTFFSIDIHTSIFGYYGRFNGGLLSIIAYILLFVIFIQNFSKNDVKDFLKVSLLSSTVVILWGLPGKFGADFSCLLFTGKLTNICWSQQFRPAERMFSTLGQPNWLGAYLAIHFFIGLYFLITNDLRKKEETKKTKKHYEEESFVGMLGLNNPFVQYVLYGIYIVLNFAALVFTRSRSAMGAVAISLVVLLLYMIVFHRKYIQETFKKFLPVIVIGVLVVLFYKTGIESVDKYINIVRKPFITEKNVTSPLSPPVIPSGEMDSNVTDSFDIRKIVWKGATDLGFKYPLTGTGVETFAYAYYFTRPVEHNHTSEWDFIYNKAHNEFLNYFATTGFIGLGSYVLVIIFTFWIFFKMWRKREGFNNEMFIVCLCAAYITIHVTNFFGFAVTSINIFFFLIPAILIISQKQEIIFERIKKVSLYRKIVIGGVFALTLLLFVNLVQYYLADRIYAQANREIALEEYQAALNSLDTALKLHNEHVYEDKLSIVLAQISYVAAVQKESDLAQRLIDLSKAYNKRTLVIAPKNVLYWKTRAKNYYVFYQITNDKKDLDEALASLLIAREIAPTEVKLLHSIAVFYEANAEMTKDPKEKQEYLNQALETINQALREKPNYQEAKEVKADIEKRMKGK